MPAGSNVFETIAISGAIGEVDRLGQCAGWSVQTGFVGAGVGRVHGVSNYYDTSPVTRKTQRNWP